MRRNLLVICSLGAVLALATVQGARAEIVQPGAGPYRNRSIKDPRTSAQIARDRRYAEAWAAGWRPAPRVVCRTVGMTDGYSVWLETECQ